MMHVIDWEFQFCIFLESFGFCFLFIVFFFYYRVTETAVLSISNITLLLNYHPVARVIRQPYVSAVLQKTYHLVMCCWILTWNKIHCRVVKMLLLNTWFFVLLFCKYMVKGDYGSYSDEKGKLIFVHVVCSMTIRTKVMFENNFFFSLSQKKSYSVMVTERRSIHIPTTHGATKRSGQ